MDVRILVVATAIAALAAPAAMAVTPAATRAAGQQVPVEAIMTLHRLGSEDWQLDIENSTPLAVTIRRITWSAPAGLKVDRIVGSSRGVCKLYGRGFRCWTRLAGPLCPTCQGSDLSVHFEGSGPKRRWVGTGTGGFWEQEPLQNGHAVLVASAATRRHTIR
jgi:hypothetical protein